MSVLNKKVCRKKVFYSTFTQPEVKNDLAKNTHEVHNVSSVFDTSTLRQRPAAEQHQKNLDLWLQQPNM